MAKKQDNPMTNIFARTEAPSTAPAAVSVDDKVKPIGIGLKRSEWERLQQIANEVGMKRHELTLKILRDFIRRYDAGEVETETRKTLKI